MLIALRLITPNEAKNAPPAFGFQQSTSLNEAARLMSFTGSISHNKVFLRWIIDENGSADQFEVEKSADGKNFSLAALVFASEKPDWDNYFFYEKFSNKKFYYRIRLVDKDRDTRYSPVIEIGPKS